MKLPTGDLWTVNNASTMFSGGEKSKKPVNFHFFRRDKNVRLDGSNNTMALSEMMQVIIKVSRFIPELLFE